MKKMMLFFLLLHISLSGVWAEETLEPTPTPPLQEPSAPTTAAIPLIHVSASESSADFLPHDPSADIKIMPLPTPSADLSLRDVLKNDLLQEYVQKRNQEQSTQEQKALEEKKKLYQFPTKPDFWKIMSELWLVKNGQQLGWDFSRPQYGVDQALKEVLEGFGYFELEYRILIVNNSELAYTYLPSDKKTFYFLISLPFMKALDLSKLEISLLLFETFVRADFDYFENYVYDKGLDDHLGVNFFEKEIKTSLLTQVQQNYSQFVFQKGYSYQQQYEVTKKLKGILKNNMKFFETYKSLVTKIDTLVKNDARFRFYSRYYPSPEMQLNWLKND